MDYDKEFEEWFKKKTVAFSYDSDYKHDLYEAWQAARKNHYRIGEEVEICDSLNDDIKKFIKGRVMAFAPSKGFTTEANDVRRIPAWEPKEGEVVFVKTTDGIIVGKVKCYGEMIAIESFSKCPTFFKSDIKPFSADKIGKPWDEI